MQLRLSLVRVLTAAAAVASFAHTAVLFPRYVITDPAVPLGLRFFIGSITLTVTAGLAASILALVLVVRSWQHQGARTLALFLAAAGTLWGSVLRLLDISVTGRNLNLAIHTSGFLQGLILTAAIVLAAASFLRFSALFPATLDAAALRPPKRLRVLHRLRRALLRGTPVWLTALVTLLVLTTYSRWGPELVALLLTGTAGPATELMQDPRVRKTFLTGLVALLVTGLVLMPVAAMALGASNLIAGYRLAGAADRRRVLWLVAGAATAAWMVLAPLVVIPLLLAAGVSDRWLPFVGGFLWFLAPAVLVTAAAVAVFYAGAVDPRLVLKRSTRYAILGAAAFILFTTLENVLSGWVEAALGLPGLVGSLAAGLLSATVLLPLQRRLGRITATPPAPPSPISPSA